MRHAHSNPHFSQAQRSAPYGGAIEWEELPSLVDSLAARVLGARQRDSGAARSCNTRPVWDATCPVEFDPAPRSQPFAEPLRGMAMREVNEPDVFRHFFGAALAGVTQR